MVTTKKIQIVCFDLPYPANYGGVIDVFYKIKALYEKGIHIYLHVFLYANKTPNIELEKYCKKVYYYPRREGILPFFSFLPYIVNTRKSKDLEKNLKGIQAPVLIEGIHGTYLLKNKNQFNYPLFVRTHNVEHHYYWGLFLNEKNCLKKLFFFLESYKLKWYEHQLAKANQLFTISDLDQQYFKAKYQNTTLLPVFANYKLPTFNKDTQPYLLWHGDLRVNDNLKSVKFAISCVRNTSYKLVIASSYPPKKLINEVAKHPNIHIDVLPHADSLEKLIRKAHINLLFTYQQTGIKLKLLNAAIHGNFIITNRKMVAHTPFEKISYCVEDISSCQKTIQQLLNTPYSEALYKEKLGILEDFNPQKNIEILINYL